MQSFSCCPRGHLSAQAEPLLRQSPPALPKEQLDLLGVREDARLTAVASGHRPFLTFHRDRVFIRHDAQD
jgi:hypothetical protein